MGKTFSQKPSLEYGQTTLGHQVIFEGRVVYTSRSKCSATDVNQVMSRVNLAFALGATKVTLESRGAGMIDVWRHGDFLGAF